MGIKLLFFTGFSKFVAHESVAFMLVLFSCYSRCLLVFLGGVYSGLVGSFFSFKIINGKFEYALIIIKKC